MVELRPREPLVRDLLPVGRFALVARLAPLAVLVPVLRVARADVDDLARLAVERLAVLRAPVERLAVLRAPDERSELLLVELSDSSPVHLPDITRCAASATASAISDPSLEALETTLLAACCAVSAASIPASRIARRAFGLAAIAAAAAVRPAAIISRLIAAFASLSTVLSLDEDFDRVEPVDFFELVDLLLLALAIAILPCGIALSNHCRSVTVPPPFNPLAAAGEGDAGMSAEQIC